ncbi:MAG TPA: hypothetical protein VN939_04565 [Chthoniobacterales bacterium]|nr:hypothetical protein [Chthoniobacterales bacterium]
MLLILLSPEAVPAVALSIVNVVGLFVLARHPTRPIHNVLAFTWSYVAWALAYSFGKQYAEKRSNERLIFSLLPRVLLAPVAGLLTLSWAIGYYRAWDIVKESHQAVIELKSKAEQSVDVLFGSSRDLSYLSHQPAISLRLTLILWKK